jgi:hypothetical protein
MRGKVLLTIPPKFISGYQSKELPTQKTHRSNNQKGDPIHEAPHNSGLGPAAVKLIPKQKKQSKKSVYNAALR